jgi:hypothetical protein
MERMAEPHAVQRVLELLSGWAGAFERTVNSFAQRVGNAIERRLFHQSR